MEELMPQGPQQEQMPQEAMPQEPMPPQNAGEVAPNLEPTNPFDTSEQEGELSTLENELKIFTKSTRLCTPSFCRHAISSYLRLIL